MYRSLSSTRVAEDYNINVGSPSSKSPGLRVSVSNEELPVYDPVSEMAKKERSRIKFAENAVHVIPFVLLLCAIILWVFSNPDVDVGIKNDSIAARIKGLSLEGDEIDEITTNNLLPTLEFGELEHSRKQAKDHKAIRRTKAKSKFKSR
ncbi:hypothetical protein PVL29_020781 [Vitis rotundifolia]|uniref:Transmembrane protein n=1 Tax=Vitis rotundifolia TaxID=103349 RepID=A0AA39DDX9_VITRO|nr:hypothetical protein PVL29_020781 [Vitis rotundifolia]